MMKKQKGVALIGTLMVSIIITAIMLGVIAILLNRGELIRNISDSMPAFYIAHTGIEKALYYDSMVPSGATSGLCNIAANCPTDATNPSELAINCNNVVVAGSDCDPATCANCTVSFESNVAGKRNTVSAKVVCAQVQITSKGFFKGILREVSFSKTNGNLETVAACFLPL